MSYIYYLASVKSEYLLSITPLYQWILQFSSVQSLSRVRLFATPWITARQASLSITNSRSSLRLTSIESMMPSSHLILCRPLLLLPPIPPSIRVWVNSLHEVTRLYLRCSYFCFVYPVFILVTISVSDLGVSAQISLLSVCSNFLRRCLLPPHLDGRNSFVTVRKMWKSRKDRAAWHQIKLIFTWKLLIHVA